MSTKLFQAVSRFSSKFRWCLTGTPIQNCLEDLASLVAFIRVSPLHTLPEFRKHIINPLTKGKDQGSNRLRILLDSICLRRTKKLLNLPDIMDEDRYIDFSTLERKFYNETQAEMIAEVKLNDSQARNSKDYFGMFQLQLQLRRLCNHGTFQKAVSKSPADDLQFDPEQAFEILQEKGNANCTYCNIVIGGVRGIEDKQFGSFSVCGHLFCFECVSQFKATLRKISSASYECSICTRTLPENCMIEHAVHADGLPTIHGPALFHCDRVTVSSKVVALIHDLKTNDNEGKR
jgi:SWI/SNF-related matrix-associated actin-dependent regulator of chromatin subfamily A3